jgi:hypothetical protein
VLQKNQMWDVTLCCGIVVCSVFNAHGSFEMSRSITPLTWCSIPQDLNLPGIVSSTKHVLLGLSAYVAQLKNYNFFLFVAFNHSQYVLVYFLCSSFNFRPLL